MNPNETVSSVTAADTARLWVFVPGDFWELWLSAVESARARREEIQREEEVDDEQSGFWYVRKLEEMRD